MDLNDIRITWTVASFFVFLAIVAWAFSRDACAGLERAGHIPLDEDAPIPPAGARGADSGARAGAGPGAECQP